MLRLVCVLTVIVMLGVLTMPLWVMAVLSDIAGVSTLSHLDMGILPCNINQYNGDRLIIITQ